MIRVLSNTSCVSGKMLAESLRLLGERCYGTVHVDKINRGELVVRYGSTEIHSGINTINSLEVIRTCSNKLLFSQLMEENDIYSPIFLRGTPTSYPVIVRTTLNSYGGRGMYLIQNRGDYDRQFYSTSHYWTPYVETDFELRVHVLGGRIARIFRKEGGENFIRTSNNGWHFSLRNVEDYPKVQPLVERLFAIPMFRSCFMALDLGWDSAKRSYFIFEGNSAPGLNEHTSSIYAEYILGVINQTYR